MVVKARALGLFPYFDNTVHRPTILHRQVGFLKPATVLIGVTSDEHSGQQTQRPSKNCRKNPYSKPIFMSLLREPVVRTSNFGFVNNVPDLEVERDVVVEHFQN
jgi:hypothetical protein